VRGEKILIKTNFTTNSETPAERRSGTLTEFTIFGRQPGHLSQTKARFSKRQLDIFTPGVSL